ncbi:MAG: WG repeat-containing protein [Campylobacterota bacterium]|nr:WG repeat-containing protein [Campylobacterota bacterium]
MKKYIPFKKNGRWGILNPANNQTIIEPKYQSLFANGDYPKNFFKVVEDYDCGIKEFYFINYNGEIVSDRVEIEKDALKPRCIPNATKKEETLYSISIDEKSVFYNYDGVKVFDREFDYVDADRIFFDEFHKVKLDEKYGVINKKSEFIIEPIYSSILLHWDKEYIILKNNEKTSLYRIKDGVYLEFDCEDIYIANEFIFIKKEKYAIFSKKFEKQSDFIYEKIITNDKVIVAKKDGRVGMMDMQFNTLIPFIYESLGFLYYSDAKEYGYFRDDRLIAELDNTWLVIDDKNNTIFSSEENYDNNGGVTDFSWKYIPSLDGYIEHLDEKILFHTHNKTKEYLVENIIAVTSYDDDYGLVIFYAPNDKQGFINLKTDYISEPIFDDIDIVEADKIVVCVDNKWGMIDSVGEYILKPKYIDTISSCHNKLIETIVSLQKYDFDFLDECDSFSVNGGYITTFIGEDTVIYNKLR